MASIFISYSRRDATKTEPIFAALQEHQYQLWFDTDIIGTGDYWQREIGRAIQRCDVFLLTLTSNSITSTYCRFEWEYALQMEKQIIPVLLEPVAFPPGLPPYKSFDLTTDSEKTIQELIRHIQWAVQSNTRRLKLLSMMDEPQQPAVAAGQRPKRGRGIEQPRSIHIMTSAKGEVGKTMLTLALSYYYNKKTNSESTLVVDMCHYVQDAYNCLSDKEHIYPSPPHWLCTGRHDTSSGWIVAPEKAQKQSIGYENFWKQLQEIVNFPAYMHHNLLVDTNLDIGNLYIEPQKKNNKFQQIIAHKNIRLYIWFIWSRRELLNAEDIAQSVDHFYAMLGDSERERVEFIHVLNPCAIDTVQDIWKRVTARIYRSQRHEIQDKVRTTLSGLDHKRRTDTTNALLNIIDNEFDSLLSRFDEWQPESYTYEGLRKLLYEEPVIKDTVTVPKIQSWMTQYLSLGPAVQTIASFLDMVYETIFRGKGRPHNLFPIPTYSFRQLEQGFDPPSDRLDELEQAISKFLDDLDSIEASSYFV